MVAEKAYSTDVFVQLTYLPSGLFVDIGVHLPEGHFEAFPQTYATL